MTDSINTVVLAAGKGTRLKIQTPKPLCICLGRTLVDHVLENLLDFEKEAKAKLQLGIVIGHAKEQVEASIRASFAHSNIQFATQEEQLGTGHALKIYFEAFPSAWENKYTLISCADTPLITKAIYHRMLKHLLDNKLDAVGASFFTEDPTGYGRIEHGNPGFSIIEEKDANSDQKSIKEVNSGVYLMRTSYIKGHLAKLSSNNKSGEFYLTDLLKKEANVSSLVFDDAQSFLGVNDLVQLDEARSILQERTNRNHMRNGVRIINSSTVYIEQSVKIEAGAVIYPNTYIMGESELGANTIVEPGSMIKDSLIESDVLIKANSYFEKAHVKKFSAIGPMARLREGSQIGEGCKIGNFVETKKSVLDSGVKISHLSYVGDAKIGENTNIGCGFITCNYDGERKHQTIIGKNSFIGSDCQVVAPIEIGSNAYIGSGSTINKNVPDNAFAIARQRQSNKEDMAKRFLKTSK